MKTKLKLIASTILFLTILLGCTNTEDSFPPYTYSIKLGIKDKVGNDRLYGITTYDSLENENYYEIKENEYELSVVQTGKAKEELYVGALALQLNDPFDYLILTTITQPLTPKYRPMQLTHKIICPYVFGDDKEHIIISNWEKINTGSSKCIGIIVDDVTYSDIEYDENDYRYKVVITLEN